MNRWKVIVLVLIGTVVWLIVLSKKCDVQLQLEGRAQSYFACLMEH